MQMSVNFRGKGKKDESTFYEANEITRVTWKARQMPDPKKLKMKQQKKKTDINIKDKCKRHPYVTWIIWYHRVNAHPHYFTPSQTTQLHVLY